MALKNNILVPLPPMPWGRGRDKVGTNPGLPPSRSQSQGPHGFRTLRGAYCCLRPLPRVHLFPTPAALSKSAPCGFAQATRRLPTTPCPGGGKMEALPSPWSWHTIPQPWDAFL